jgi:hypothetical protein
MLPQYSLRVLLEQNGMINLFSVAFAMLLYLRTHRGFIEILLLVTCISGFIADVLLVFTDGPSSISITDLPRLRAMTFFEVVLWTIRELGLTLYTNRLIKILDHQRNEKVYYYGYNAMFSLILLWRLFGSGWRTYNRNSPVIAIGNYVYLGSLSLIDIWSSIFLLKSSFNALSALNPEFNSYRLIKEIVYSGILRIIFINFIPLTRLIVDLVVVSVFDYEDDVSIIVYYLQASMNLMYLIDFSIIKIEGAEIFKYTNEIISTSGNS